MRTVTVALPHGVGDGARLRREVELRPLDGDEDSFADAPPGALPAARLNAVLARAVVGLRPAAARRRGKAAGAGEDGPDGGAAEAVRRLTVGDRDALALHLHRLSFGDRMDTVLACPRDGCGERMELALPVAQLLQAPYARPRAWYDETLEADGAACRVRFRLPTAEDQEAAAAVARDGGDAAALLLGRCVERPAGAPLLSPALAEAIGRRMAELDPQADLVLELRCPACGGDFHAALDPGGFLLQELAGRARRLRREVHLLALHYHWSERDILAMGPGRRAAYLALLAEDDGRASPG